MQRLKISEFDEIDRISSLTLHSTFFLVANTIAIVFSINHRTGTDIWQAALYDFIWCCNQIMISVLGDKDDEIIDENAVI